MDLDAFVAKAWEDHTDDARGVLARIPRGLELVSSPSHVPALANLVVHVAGAHLGAWAEGVALLARLERLGVHGPPEGKALARAFAVLHRAAGEASEAARREAQAGDAAGDRVRILAVLAATLAGRRRSDEAARAFDEAAALARGIPGADPAVKTLAAQANNLALDLEQRRELSRPETDLMLRAAREARRAWELAGGWLEVERAEYRLALSHARAGEGTRAIEHAMNCIEGIRANGGDPVELFYDHEALARARLAANDRVAARIAADGAAAILGRVDDEGARRSCAAELEKLLEVTG